MCKVLICDDHKICCVGLKTVLEQIYGPSRFSFSFAHTGYDAIELFEKDTFDIVFMDMKLPDISGLDVIKSLASKLNGKKVLIFTSSNEYRSIVDLKFVLEVFPVNAILQKTFTLEKIADVFEHINHKNTPYLDVDTAELLNKELSVSLTPREFDVVEQICKGLTSKEIALKFGCSSETIKTHRARILEKTKVRNVAELSAWYLDRYGKIECRA